MNNVCLEIREVKLEGNILPTSWFKHILKDNKTKRPDLVACNILADIFYWYRPTDIRDETTGFIVDSKQKFKADKLQKSYTSYSDLFGIPKSSIKKSFDLLVNLKLITREFRNFRIDTGLQLNNVMFVEPIVKRIIDITYRI